MPGIVERHNLGISRIMLAGTVAGEAPASAIIRDLLKSDETLQLPKVEEVEIAPLIDTSKRSADEQAEVAREAQGSEEGEAGSRTRPSGTGCGAPAAADAQSSDRPDTRRSWSSR